MLLHIDGEVVEIRPSELFESKGPVESRYLELVSEPKKAGRPSKKKTESLDGSSTQSRS
jgi:hypothetical protein